MRIAAYILSILIVLLASADAAQPKRYASIIVDADSLEIIHARQIDEPRFPASLTKVMTLYLTFDAINAGQLRLDESLTVSAHAASTPPVGLGLKAGQTITVDEAIQALTVRSANDAAVVLAERIAGSDEAFAALMTAKAHQMGMISTTFKTPHGLPHPEQKTTARDMAKLASSILRDHPGYYHYFGQTTFTWKGYRRKNTNALLHWLAGVDGFKTGYTNDSGYNLIISAKRDGRRIIAVVLGGASGKSRNTHMQDLVEKGFDVLGVRPVRSFPPAAIAAAEPDAKKTDPKMASAIRLRGRNNEPLVVSTGIGGVKVADARADRAWSVQVGTFSSEDAASQHLADIEQRIPDGSDRDPYIAPMPRSGKTLYRARLGTLTAREAASTCELLSNLPGGCLVIAPG